MHEIHPKDGEHGIKFIYDLRLEHLSDDEAQTKIAELKALSLPAWWPLHSDKVQRLLHGEDYVPKFPVEDDEFYMALFSNLLLMRGKKICDIINQRIK